MTDQTDAVAAAGNVSDSTPAVPPWLRATLADVQSVDFEAPIAASITADSNEIGDQYRAFLKSNEQDGELPDTPAVRVAMMLSAVAGMHFKPEQRNEPYGPMFTFADGRRSAVPEDFRAHIDILAHMAERATNPVLRARLCDVCWLLDRKRGELGTLAISSLVEVFQKADAGQLKWRFAEDTDNPGLKRHARDYLRRALQIGRALGWDKKETIAARNLVAELRKRANDAVVPVPVHWFSSLDLDFSISDPAEVAATIENVIKSLQQQGSWHVVLDLWRLAARAYHVAKDDDAAYRCKSAAAECLVTEAESAFEKQKSAMLASHHLSAAIAELHGIPGKKDRRTALRHRLIDIQAHISEEMSTFTQEFDLKEIAEQTKGIVEKLGLVDKLLSFAVLARSPEPDALEKEAKANIEKFPLSSLLGSSHLDGEGKTIHRTEGGVPGGNGNDPAVRAQLAQAETIRRKLVAFGKIDPARRTIVEQHYVSDDVFATLLQYSPFVPHDLLGTFAKGFAQFFRGDFVSATYILTPLLENSLRHLLRAHGHDVTVFDDATQTQQDRTISALFEQMRPELEGIFPKAITDDLERVFLAKTGPYLRHSLAHGLLHDWDPYGSDALYGCWLIMQLCLIPLLNQREELNKLRLE
jgi:hypothetical protein